VEPFRTTLPAECPPQLFDLVVSCSEYLAVNRPHFRDVLPKLKTLVVDLEALREKEKKEKKEKSKHHKKAKKDETPEEKAKRREERRRKKAEKEKLNLSASEEK